MSCNEKKREISVDADVEQHKTVEEKISPKEILKIPEIEQKVDENRQEITDRPNDVISFSIPETSLEVETSYTSPALDLSSFVDPLLLDERLLITSIESRINDLRKNAGLRLLNPRRNLKDAATLQNEYCVARGSLSHQQPDSRYQTVRDRVIHLGGRYRRVGENVQYYGLLNSTVSGQKYIMNTSYKEAIEGIVENWITSSGHYENLMHPDFRYVGTAVGWNANLTSIFVTQVYASDL